MAEFLKAGLVAEDRGRPGLVDEAHAPGLEVQSDLPGT
jgi:hypothetical protein